MPIAWVGSIESRIVRALRLGFLGAFCSLSILVACDDSPIPEAPLEPGTAEIGPEGGTIEPPVESAWHGVKLVVPAGALKSKTRISFKGATDETNLPELAERVGPYLAFDPPGLDLAVPAELTVPLAHDLLANYEGKPEGCKVWARKDDAWTRIEQIRSTKDSVTIPISRLTTLAAGVIFTPTNQCTKTAIASGACQPNVPAAPTCEPLSATSNLCLLELPQPPRGTTFAIDEFSTLSVRDEAAYWVTWDNTNDLLTIARYDLKAPGPVQLYRPLRASPVGTIAGRGRVAVLADKTVWASVGGFGNIRFSLTEEPRVFDRPSTTTSRGPVGVVTERINARNVQRFSKINVGDKTDVRYSKNTDTTQFFAFNYPFTPIETINGFLYDDDSLEQSGVSGVHRGPAELFGHVGNPPAINGDFAFATIEFGQGGLGSIPDIDSTTYGPSTADTTTEHELLGAVKNGELLVYEVRTFHFKPIAQQLPFRFPVPSGARDVAFADLGQFDLDTPWAIASGRTELFQLRHFDTPLVHPMPEGSSFTPWVIRQVHHPSGPEDLLVVTRGPLTNKGAFYLLKKRPQ